MAERIGKPSRIAPLSDFDDRDVAAGDVDVRGWDVIAADGERLGVVDELLIDTGTGRVRYLDVDLEDDLVEAVATIAATSEAQAPSQKIERRTDSPAPADLEGVRHILLPIGQLRLDADAEQVFLGSMGSREAAALPAYRPGASLPALERALAERFGPTPKTGDTPSVPTATTAEDRFWRSGAGAADIGTVPPEPGTTPAELEPEELEPGLEAAKRGSR